MRRSCEPPPTRPGSPLSLTVRSRCAALRGREAELSELIQTSVSEAQARGEGLALTITEFLSGTLYLGLGRYDAALTAVGQPERYAEEGPAIWTLVELIEAAVRSGQPHLAGGALELIVETTRAAGTDWALGIEARAARCSATATAAEPLSRGDRTARPHTPPHTPRPRPPPLRRVAAP